ncbi:hypothetical protein AVEN_192145-1 [Araneus ventricosus]|uniref:Uncharacterized protein n=1 Tax=Araneus ventricosus TaxID=182803 RepID=A0A4Y2LJT0_ARAVE|nr:hypothetical protein AVEN_192145-1 [Araneus ventricosus]
MGKRKSGPFSGQQIATNTSKSNFPTFFIIKRVSTSAETFHSVSPFLVERAITGSIGDVKSTKKLRSGDLLVEVQSRKQSEQIVKLKTFSNIQITVSPHTCLNSSKGVITCGELLNVTTEEILKELQEVGHESTDCTRAEKCVNCKEEPTSLSRNCFAWKQEKEIISTKIKKQISYQEARKLVKSQTPTPGNSYVSVVKTSTAPSSQTNPDIAADSRSKQSASTPRAPPAMTNQPSFPSVAPLCEKVSASPDLTDFKLVTNKKKLKKDSPTKTNNTITIAEKVSKFYTTSSREVSNTIPTKDNISRHKSTLKPFETPKPSSVDTELLPMAVLPPLERRILQSRESDADAEMSSSSASEGDTLEYNMSEDLEDSPEVISPPSSSKSEKTKNKYIPKNYKNG